MVKVVEKKKIKRTRVVKTLSRIQVTVTCPHCGEDMNISHVPVGEVLSCVGCGAPFKIANNADVKLPPVLQRTIGVKLTNNSKVAAPYYVPNSNSKSVSTVRLEDIISVCPNCRNDVVLDTTIVDNEDIDHECPHCQKYFKLSDNVRLKLPETALTILRKQLS